MLSEADGSDVCSDAIHDLIKGCEGIRSVQFVLFAKHSNQLLPAILELAESEINVALFDRVVQTPTHEGSHRLHIMECAEREAHSGIYTRTQ